MRQYFKIVSTLAIAAAIALSASSASAYTAANTLIKNTATLTYTGGSKDATAIVTVSLVPGTPNLFLSPNNGAYLKTNDPILGDTLLITSTANGPAWYHVTAAIGDGSVTLSPGVTNAVVNATGASVAPSAAFDVYLGASVTTATASRATSASALIIPAPDAAYITGSAGSYTVNGIAKDDTISFGSYTRIVGVIAYNSADSTFTLPLDQVIDPATVPAGTPVYEQQSVSGITASPGTVTNLGTDINVYARAKVTTTGASDAYSNWAKNVWTSAKPNVLLNKWTRAVPPATGNPTSGDCFDRKSNYTVNGNSETFYPCGVTGKTNDKLEYVVFAGNQSFANPADNQDLTDSVITDVLPTAYVTLVTGAFGGGTNDVFYSPDGTGGAGSVSLAIGTSNQAFMSTWPIPVPNPPSVTLNVNVGTGASTGPGPGKGGIIPKPGAGLTTGLFIAYQVTIK